MKSNNGRLIVVKKDKNDIFSFLYQLTKREITEQLLSLKSEDFAEKRESTHPDHIGESLYIWSPIRILRAQDGTEVEERLYVKTYLDEKKKLVVVISFHRDGDFA